METLTLPGRKADSFLQMGIGKKLDGFGNGSRYMAITGIIYLSIDQYAVHKHQIDLYHTAFYYHNSLSV